MEFRRDTKEAEAREAAERREATSDRSAGQLIEQLSKEAVTMLRQEVALAKQEMSEKASIYMRNFMVLAVGGLIAYAGLLALVAAVTAGLAVAMATEIVWGVVLWLSPLIVGVVVALIGYAMVKKAKTTMKHEGLTPNKTVKTLQENKEWLKNEVK